MLETVNKKTAPALGHDAFRKRTASLVVIVIVALLLDNGGAYSHRAAHRIVKIEARRAGFDTIDLTDEFMRAGMGNLVLSLGSTRSGGMNLARRFNAGSA